MDLLEALEIIRNASDASLHSHAEQTILIIKDISQRLHDLSPNSQATPMDPGSVPSPPHSPPDFQVTETTTFGKQSSGLGPASSQLQVAGFSDSRAFSDQHPSVPSPPYLPQTFQAAEMRTLEAEVIPSSQISHVTGPEAPLSPQTAQSIPSREPPRIEHREKATTYPDNIPRLLKGVKRSACLIWKEVDQKSLDDLLSRKRKSDADPRLEHIRCIEGDKSLGNKEKLLRVLALRSIALEFTKKQHDNGVSPTRLHALYQQTLNPEDPNSSRANIFNIGNKDFLTKSLATGLKYLVFEKVIAAHCHDKQNPPIEYIAISAIVGLQIDQFRRFRYDEMQSFAQKLKSDDKDLKLSDQKMCLLDAVQSLSPWFNDVQKSYNLIFQNPFPGLESSIQKVPRIDLDSTPHMRDNLIECPMSIPQDSVPSTLDFGHLNIPSNGVDTHSLAVFPEDEFAHQLYEQISNQPINFSAIMDDVATRACFDFENITPYNVAVTSPETSTILTR